MQQGHVIAHGNEYRIKQNIEGAGPQAVYNITTYLLVGPLNFYNLCKIPNEQTNYHNISSQETAYHHADLPTIRENKTIRFITNKCILIIYNIRFTSTANKQFFAEDCSFRHQQHFFFFIIFQFTRPYAPYILLY